MPPSSGWCRTAAAWSWPCRRTATRSRCSATWSARGSTSPCASSDIADLDAVTAACADGASAIYCETIANPGSTIADLDALGLIARGAGARLIVDSTLATPLLCQPLAHGAHVVLHSATKFLNGHHDVLAGAICARRRSASDSQPADRHRRRGRARHGLAAAPGHAHAGVAHGAPVRERAAIADWLESRADVVSVPSPACRRTRSTPSPVACWRVASAVCWRSRSRVAAPAARRS